MGIWRAGAVCCPLNVEMNIAYIPELLGACDARIVLWHESMDVKRMTEGVAGKVVKFTSWSPDLKADAKSDELFRAAGLRAVATTKLDSPFRLPRPHAYLQLVRPSARYIGPGTRSPHEVDGFDDIAR